MDNSSSLFIVIGVLAVLCLGLLTILILNSFQKRKFKNQHSEQGQAQRLKTITSHFEREWSKAGIELRDDVGAILSSVKLNLENSQNKNLDPQIKHDLNNAINKLRIISQGMAPVVLKKYGLKEAVQELIRRSETINISEFRTESLSENQALTVFRIIQECVAVFGKLHISLKIDRNAILELEGHSISIDVNNFRYLIEGLALSIDSNVTFSHSQKDVMHIVLVVPAD